MQNKKKPSREPSKTLPSPLGLVAGIGIALVAFPVCLLLVIHLPAVQKQVMDQVIRQIERNSGLEVHIEGCLWHPFSGLSLRDLKVRSAESDLLDCSEARLTYHLSWAWPYLLPEELYLEKPLIRLERNAQGQWQVPKAARKKSESDGEPARKESPWWVAFPLPKVRVADGTIYARQGEQTILSIRNVTGSLDVHMVSGPNGPTIAIDLGQWYGQAEVPRWGAWQLSGEMKLEGNTLQSERLVLSLGERGALSCKGTCTLGPPLAVDLSAQMESLRWGDFPELLPRFPDLEAVSGSLHLASAENGIWVLDHDLHTNLGSLKGTLKLQPDASAGGPRAEWTSHVADVTLKGIKELPEAHLSGQLELSVQGDRPETLQVQLKSRLEPSRWGGEIFEKGEISGSYDRGLLDFNASRIQSSMADFSLTARADLQGLWDPKHPGEAKLELQVDRASLQGIVSQSRERVGGSIRAEGKYAPGSLLNWKQWQARVDANVAIPELLSLKAAGSCKDEALDVNYELGASDLRKLSVFFPFLQAEGQVASKGNIKGKWPELTWEGEAGGNRLSYGPVKSDQLSVRGKSALKDKEGARKLSLKAQNLEFDGKKIASLLLDIDQQKDTLAFQVKADQVLNQVGARFSGKVGGLWSSPRSVSIQSGQIAWKDQTVSVDGKVQVGTETVAVESLNLSQGKQKVRLSGQVVQNGRADLNVTLEGISAGQWMRVLGQDKMVTGNLSGQIRLSGNAGQPEGSVNLQLTNGSLRNQERIDKLQLQGSYSRNLLQLQGDLASQATEAPVHVSTKIPMQLSLLPFHFELRQADEWVASSKVTGLQCKALLPYIDVLDQLGGEIQGEVQGSGSLGRPVLRGGGTLSHANFRVKIWPHPVENLQAEWTADSKQIQIMKSTMKLLGGQVEITGNVDYPRFEVMEYEAVGRDLEFPPLYGITGKVSGRAHYVQDLQGAQVSAKLQFSTATMNLGHFETDLAKNIEIIDDDSKADIVEIRGDEKNKSSYYNRLKLDLTFDLPRSGTWVRGKGLEAEIVGALRLEKDGFSGLKFSGGFQTLRGSYTFQGNTLKIVNGELIFLGASHPEPILKILCQKELHDVTIQVQVNGPISQPKLALSSVPSLNQVDILSYLFFGHPAGELNSSESSQLQDRAASWVGSQTSQMLKKVLGNTPFAPDTLQVKSPTSSRTERSTTKEEGRVIEIGKYVTPDLYVTYEKGVMGGKENDVQVEYRLNRHLSVQTEIGGDQQGGVDVFWRYDFGK